MLVGYFLEILETLFTTTVLLLSTTLHSNSGNNSLTFIFKTVSLVFIIYRQVQFVSFLILKIVGFSVQK